MRRPDLSGISLVLLGLVTLASFHRLLQGWAWLLPAAVAALLALAIGRWLRSLGLWRTTSLFLTAAAGVIYVAYVIFPETLFAGLPTPESAATVVGSVGEAWGRMQTALAPAPSDAGFLTLLVLATWTAGAMSGVFPPRAAAWVWLALFLIPAGLGVPQGRYLALIAFLSAGVLHLFASAPGSRGRLRLPGAAAAARIGASAAALALALPLLLPGYGSAAVVLPTVAPDRTVLSPLVEIRPRLVEVSPNRLFLVETAKPRYWRLAGLDTFDGERWRLRGEFDKVSGRVAPAFPPKGRTETLEQTFTIAGLGGSWVPAAYAPRELQGMPALFEPIRDTLIVDELQPGMRYRVVSEIPAPTREQLAAATVGRSAPGGSLELPDNLSPRVREIAASLTSQASSPYQAAMAIQNHLRSFTYTLQVPAGHGGDYLVRFLTEIRAGYCEQFASAMAVLARASGLPARVAVGFLPGDAAGAAFSVTGEHAHAWTEIFFDGIGWVAFEPTPRSESPPPDYAAAPAAAAFDEEGPLPQDPVEAQPPPPEVAEDIERPSPLDAARGATLRLLLGLGILLVTLVSARAAGFRWLGRGDHPSQEVRASFLKFQILGADLIRPRTASETEREYLQHLARSSGLDAHDLAALLRAFLASEYSHTPPSPEEVAKGVEAARRLVQQLRGGSGLWGRLRAALSPRPLVVALQLELPVRRLMRSSSAARSV